MRSDTFTPEQDEIIRRDYRRRLTADIAREIGRAVTAVYCRAKYLGLAKPRRENGYMGRVFVAVRPKLKRARRTKFTPYPAAPKAGERRAVHESKRALATKPAKLVAPQDLRIDHCRFPYGDVGEPGFGFCGRHVECGQVYCCDHQRIVYIKIVKSEAA